MKEKENFNRGALAVLKYLKTGTKANARQIVENVKEFKYFNKAFILAGQILKELAGELIIEGIGDGFYQIVDEVIEEKIQNPKLF